MLAALSPGAYGEITSIFIFHCLKARFLNNLAIETHCHMKKTVVVLGVGRSGTSLISGILHILGIDMGCTPGEGSRRNPTGGYEDRAVKQLIKKILSSVAKDDYDAYWNPPSQEKMASLKGKFDSDIKHFISIKSKDKNLWGWKFPQTILLTELFLPHLENPYFVVVTRNQEGNLRSILNTTDVTPSHALKIYNLHNQSIVDFLNAHPSLPRIFVTFEGILKNPIGEAERLADFLDVSLTNEKIQKIHKLVIPRSKIKKEKLKAAIFRDVPRFTKQCISHPLKVPKTIVRLVRDFKKIHLRKK